MKCPTCNTEIPEGSSTCPGCGADTSAMAGDENTGAAGGTADSAAGAAADSTADGAAGAAADSAADSAAGAVADSAADDAAGVVTGAAADHAADTSSDEAAVKAQEDAIPENASVPGSSTSADVAQGGAPGPESQETKPEKKSMMKWIIGGAVVVAAAVVCILVATMNGGEDPKTTVVDAFKSIYTKEADRPMEELFGFKQIQENYYEKSAEVDMNLAIAGSPSPEIQALTGSGVSVNGKVDVENKKYAMSMALQLSGMDFASADIYADETNLMVALPGLSTKVLSLNYADDLEGQLKASPVLGPVILESGMDLQAFGDYFNYIKKVSEEKKGDIFGLKDLWKRYKESSQIIDQLKEAMTAEKKDTKVLTIDGADVKCKGYDAVIPKDAAITFVKDTSKFFLEDESLKKDFLDYLDQVITLSSSMNPYYLSSMNPEDMQTEAWEQMQNMVDMLVTNMEEYMGDIHLTVYVDKKGRMASMDISTTVKNTMYEAEVDGNSATSADEADVTNVTLHADFMGGTYLTQNMYAELVLEDADEKVTLKMEKKGTYENKKLTCNLLLSATNDDELYQVSYDGELDGQSGDYQIAFGLLEDGMELYGLRSEGAVSIVKGQSYDITLDSLDFLASGQSVLTLSGTYGYKPLETEILVPEGEQMDMLAATAEDWESYGMEIYNNVIPLLYSLPGM